MKIYYIITIIFFIFSLNAKEKEKKKDDLFLYANLLFKQEKYYLAIKKYKKSIEKKESNADDSLFYIILCYLKTNQITKAEESLNIFVNKYQKNEYYLQALSQLAKIKYNKKKYKKAEKTYEFLKNNTKEKNKKNEYIFLYAKTLNKNKKFEQSLTELQKLLKKPLLDELKEKVLLETSNLYIEIKNKEKAINYLEEAIKLTKNSNKKNNLIVKLAILYSKIKEYEKSNEYFLKADKRYIKKSLNDLIKTYKITNFYNLKKYKETVKFYENNKYKYSERNKKEILKIIAISYNKLKEDYLEEKYYLKIINLFKKEIQEIIYFYVRSLYVKKDRMFLYKVNKILDKIDESKNNKYSDFTWFIIAKWNLKEAQKIDKKNLNLSSKRNNFLKNSYEACEKINIENIPDKRKEDFFHHKIFISFMLGKLNEGIEEVSTFIKNFPDSKYIPFLLERRSSECEKNLRLKEAKKDYLFIINSYPEFLKIKNVFERLMLIYEKEKNFSEITRICKEIINKNQKIQIIHDIYYWLIKSYYKQKDYENVIKEIKNARKIENKNKYNYDSIIIFSYYYLNKLDDLVLEIIKYIEKKEKNFLKKEDNTILGILKITIKDLVDNKKFSDAKKFLTFLIANDNEKKLFPINWKYLAQTYAHFKEYKKAIKAYDTYIKKIKNTDEIAKSFLEKGVLELKIKDFESSKKSAYQSLRIKKEGIINIRSRILMGDIAVKEGDLEKGVREYIIINQIFKGRDITPQVLKKIIETYRKLGKEEKAKIFEEELKKVN